MWTKPGQTAACEFLHHDLSPRLHKAIRPTQDFILKMKSKHDYLNELYVIHVTIFHYLHLQPPALSFLLWILVFLSIKLYSYVI